MRGDPGAILDLGEDELATGCRVTRASQGIARRVGGMLTKARDLADEPQRRSQDEQ
jgi:hypothetical protein